MCSTAAALAFIYYLYHGLAKQPHNISEPVSLRIPITVASAPANRPIGMLLLSQLLLLSSRLEKFASVSPIFPEYFGTVANQAAAAGTVAPSSSAELATPIDENQTKCENNRQVAAIVLMRPLPYPRSGAI